VQQARARIHAHTHEIHVVLQAWCMSSVRACTNICLGLLKGVCTHLEACWITRTHAPQAPAHGLHACSHSHARTHTHTAHMLHAHAHIHKLRTQSSRRAQHQGRTCVRLWYMAWAVCLVASGLNWAWAWVSARPRQSGTASSESRSCTRQARTQQGIKGLHC